MAKYFFYQISAATKLLRTWSATLLLWRHQTSTVHLDSSSDWLWILGTPSIAVQRHFPQFFVSPTLSATNLSDGT
ncbi:hypothetical protein EI94DRAFT_251059 [Lactarius quietus]|nr:hypothetical protein EI94DRAFT_251059 [Lactarius quietus]